MLDNTAPLGRRPMAVVHQNSPEVHRNFARISNLIGAPQKRGKPQHGLTTVDCFLRFATMIITCIIRCPITITNIIIISIIISSSIIILTMRRLLDGGRWPSSCPPRRG